MKSECLEICFKCLLFRNFANMKKKELILNGKDAWATYGVRMGSGFIDALEADADNKEYITNEVRTEHGTRIVPVRPKKSSRTVTLEFVIKGTTHDDYVAKMKVFDNLMDNGFITLQIPYSKDDIYRLFCARKSSSYSHGTVIGKKSIKFTEPDPTNRGELTEVEEDYYDLKEYEDYIDS